VAGEIPPLEVQVLLNTSGVSAGVSQAEAGLRKVGVAAEETGNRVSSMGTSMLKSFAAMAAVGGVTELLRSSVEAAKEAEVAQSKLSVAMTNMGVNTEASKKAIDASIESIQKLGFKTADSTAAMGGLITVTGSVTESTTLMSVAADLARYKHESLAEAASTLGKATTGSAKAFREFGIVLDSHLPKNQAIAKAFDELNAKIGGEAIAHTHTYAGEMEILSTKMEGVKETIGKAVIPAIVALGTAVSTVLPPIISFFKKYGDAIFTTTVIVGGAIAAFKLYETAMGIFKAAQIIYIALTSGMFLAQEALIAETALGAGATKAMAAAQWLLNLAMDANPIGLIIAGVVALVAIFVIAWRHSNALRNAIIDIGIFGIHAVADLIEWFGKFVQTIMVVTSGPLKLLLEGLAFLHVPGAKAALNDLNGAVKNVGDFFDKTAKSVDNYRTTLEQAKRPTDVWTETDGSGDGAGNGLVPPKVPLHIHGQVPGGDGLAKAAAARAKHLDLITKNVADINKLYDDQATALKDRQTKMGDANQKHLEAMASARKIFDNNKSDLDRTHSEAFTRAKETYDAATEAAQTAHDQNLITLNNDFHTKIGEMYIAHRKKLGELQKKYADSAEKLEQNSADKRQGIIQQSIDALTNTWQSATKLDLMSLFGQGGNTGAGLVTTLKDRLTKVLKLQKDAGDLHAAGYSQGFIDQIIAKGPLIGDAMAQSILKASPDTTNQIQALYGQIQNVSSNGLDALATQMNDGTKFATDKMADQYAQVSITLQKSLADNSANLATALSNENNSYAKALDAASNAHAEALGLNETTLTTALAKAAGAQTKAQAAADQVLKDGMATATRTLTDSLASAQNAYNAAIKAISNSTNKQLDALMAKIDATAAKLRGLGAVVPSNPNAGLTPYSPVTSSGALMSGTTGTATGTATTPAQSDPSSIGRVRDSYTVNQSFGAPTVSPYELQRAMVDAITLRRVQ
jgi:hypothetical protein